MKKILVLIIVILVSGLLYSGVKELKDGIEFSYYAPDAGSVSLVGSFNNWNATADPMEKTADGRWKIILALQEGSHTYKYVVDSNWLFDDENSNIVDDGYGGSNSILEVSTSGVIKKVIQLQSEEPSSVNPKVYFDGRYYVINNMKKGDQSRYSLDKPYHDLNLGIKVKLNQNMEGYTVLNINNTTEGVDMWKTHLNFKRTYMHLNADYLNIYAFDNVGEVCFSDPLQMVGGEGYYDYDFGYGYRGVYLFTDNSMIPYAKKIPVNIKLEAFGSDQRGDAERDVNACRIQAGYDFRFFDCDHKLTLGGAIYSSRVNNQYAYVFNDTLSYSGNIVDSNPAWEMDGVLKTSLSQPGWQGAMDLYLGYEHFSFENKKEYRDFGNYDFLVSEEFVWQDGCKDHLFLKVDFPEALKLKAAYEQNEVNLHYEDFSDTVMVLPSPDVREASMKRSKWSLSASFELDNFNAEFGLSRWQTDYPDSVAAWIDYYRFIERTDGNGRWYQAYSELSFAQYLLLGYDTGVIWNVRSGYNWWKLKAEYEANIAQYDIDCKPELIENFIRLDYEISEHWQICTDTRIPIYNCEFLGLKTDFNADEDVFIANYSAIKYYINDNIWIALSYGVNPDKINEVTDEFYNGGRREYLETEGGLDEYLYNTYNGFGEKIRSAEDALAKDDRISIEAVIKF